MKRTPCRHCRIRQTTRELGLCAVCHRNPVIREQYRKAAAGRQYQLIEAELEEGAEADRAALREPRRPGEGFYRCFTCQRWRCAEPLRNCVECEARMTADLGRLKGVRA